MAHALVPVFTGTIADRTVQLCCARTLHAFMQVKRDFTTWVKGRIRKFCFVAGEDFITISRSPELGSGNRGAATDYHLTLDMAKELSMVENNAQGRAARRYFIECERQAMAASQPTPYTVQPSDTLNEPQQIALRAMLESNVKRLPHEKQAAAMVKGWSKLKAHFGVPYRQIPASEFTEALSIIARHVSEWELVEDAAKQPEAAPKPNVFMQALAAARENALSYMNGYRQAVQSGQPGPRMDDIPGALLEGIVAEALMSSRFLAGFDHRTSQMHVQLVPQDASVFSFQSGDFGQAISAIPTRRLPELQDALSKRVARHLGSLGH